MAGGFPTGAMMLSALRRMAVLPVRHRIGVPASLMLLAMTWSSGSFALPACDAVQPTRASLWPPNHELFHVGFTSSRVTAIAPYCVMQDEPLNSTGDGNSIPDAVIADAVVWLRGERKGNADGRVYRIHFTGMQDGQRCQGNVAVSVNKSANSQAVDGGPIYNAVGGSDCREPENLNTPPGLANPSLPAAHALSAWAHALQVEDSEGDAVSVTLQQAPEGLVLNGTMLGWTPEIEQVGQHGLVLRLSDDQGAWQDVSLSIEVLPPLNQPPVASGAEYTLDEDMPLALTLQV